LGKGSIASPIAAGVLTAITASIGLYGSLGDLERQHRGNLNLHDSAQRIQVHAKSTSRGTGRPMILADSGLFPQLLQYMQFMFDADWYAADYFAPRAGGGFGIAGIFQKLGQTSNDSPIALQRERMDYIDSVRKGKKDADFVQDERRLMNEALSAGRRVFVVLSPGDEQSFRRRDVGADFEMVELERWTEPCTVNYVEPGGRNWMAIPMWGDDKIVPWHAQRRVMFEIRRPAASTLPSKPENSS
jgi:hypothetical protein